MHPICRLRCAIHAIMSAAVNFYVPHGALSCPNAKYPFISVASKSRGFFFSNQSFLDQITIVSAPPTRDEIERMTVSRR